MVDPEAVRDRHPGASGEASTTRATLEAPRAPRGERLAEFAMAAGVFAMATAFAPLGLLGIGTGVFALRSRELVEQLSAAQRRVVRSRALAGIVCGGASLLLMPLMLTFALAPRTLLGALPAAADVAAESRRSGDLAALRRIWTGCLVYAALHDGAFPPTLIALRDAGQVSADDLRSRSAGVPERACDYFYVAGLRADDPPHWIMVHGDAGAAEGACVLRVDGSSEYVLRDGLEAELKRLTSEFRSARGRDLSVVLPVR